MRPTRLGRSSYSKGRLGSFVPGPPHLTFRVVDCLQQSLEARCVIDRPCATEVGPEERDLVISKQANSGDDPAFRHVPPLTHVREGRAYRYGSEAEPAMDDG